MPYWYRRRQYPRRRFYSWRPRKTFWRRRRRRWRRRRRVRRKLQSIKLRQYQPETIKKCTVKGIYPLIIGNRKRLGNNYRQYEQSLIPEYWPGGGGFSITRFTLDALYEEHKLVRNWWTATNNGLPLVRYNGAKFKLYKAEDIDYVVVIYTCFPMTATEQLYTSCQPSIQLMNYTKTIVPSKHTQPKGRPYKIKKVKPPSQMQNRWYFAKDIATTGLALITATAVDLDHYYISPWSESNNITFLSLNPTFWKLHNFQEPGEKGYLPLIEGTTEKRLWALPNGNHNLTQIQIGDLTYLGNTKQWTHGTQAKSMTEPWNLKTYLSTKRYWGNPFITPLLQTESRIIVSTKSADLLSTTYTTKTKTLQAGDFTEISQHELVECRYSPDRDRGTKTKMYLLSVIRDTKGWEQPTNENLMIYGYPLWLAAYGWLDWQRKLQTALRLERDWLVVIQSDKISPPMPYYIPLDYSFYHGHSPHLGENEKTDTDLQNWYPQVGFQEETIESIIETGPGIAKFGTKKSFECKMKYSFYWKFGGCPPKMEKITDPTEQPVYPVPNSENSTYSLQNPNMPPEALLYTFDIRKDQITKTAAKRIKKDWTTTTSLFTDVSSCDPGTAISTQETPTSSETEEDSEKEEETLLQRILRQRRKRKKLQQQLLKLMSKE